MPSLCATCAVIDFSAALAVRPSKANRHGNIDGERYPDITLDANADRFDTLKIMESVCKTGEPFSSKTPVTADCDPTCPVCQILTLTLCPGESEWSEIAVQLQAAQDPYILKAYSFALNCLWVPEDTPRVQDCHILLAVRGVDSSNGNYAKFVSEEGYVVCLPKNSKDETRETIREDFYVPRIVGEKFDADMAGRWISNCKECHEECREGSEEVLVKGMRVIDVEQRRIVAASKGMVWLALSYVWGHSNTSPDATSMEQDRVLHRLPKTIEDTIAVTKMLGYKYLWIDRYCIDQTDIVARQSQLDNMDSIYRNADLTIVAACGTDEDYGLPGVSTTARKKQPIVELDSCTILSTGPDPIAEAEKSRWWSRGWTFQEAVLSRRQLYFTDHQSFFECSCGCLMEALGGFDRPDGPVNLEKTSRRSLNLTNGFFVHAKIRLEHSTLKSVAGVDQYLRVAREYTKRDLTFDSDSLIAFAGLSTRLGNQEPRVQNLLGLPYIDPVSSDNTSDQLFAFSLCWFHIGDRAPRRRPQFPSWTWAGWAGEVKWMTGRLEEDVFMSKMRDVRLEKHNEPVSVEEYMQSFDSGSAVDGSNLVLSFEARMVPPTLFMLKEEIDWSDSDDDGEDETIENGDLPQVNEGTDGQAFAILEEVEHLEHRLTEGGSEVSVNGEEHEDPDPTVPQSPTVSPEDISLPSTPKLLPAPDPNLWSSYTVGPHSLYERSRNLDVSPEQFLHNLRTSRWSCLILGDYDGNAGYSFRRFMLVVEWIEGAYDSNAVRHQDNNQNVKGSSGREIYARRVGAIVMKRQPYVDDHEREFFEDGGLEWRKVKVV